jgi:hypothetical protein
MNTQAAHPIKELIYLFLALFLPAFFVLGMLRLHGVGATTIASIWVAITAFCFWALQTQRLHLRVSIRFALFGTLLIVAGVTAAAFMQDLLPPPPRNAALESAAAAAERATTTFHIQLLRDFYLVFTAGVGGNCLFHGICLLREENA